MGIGNLKLMELNQEQMLEVVGGGKKGGCGSGGSRGSKGSKSKKGSGSKKHKSSGSRGRCS